MPVLPKASPLFSVLLIFSFCSQLYRRGAPLLTRPCSFRPRPSCPRRRRPTSRTPPSATRLTSTPPIPSRATCRRTTRPARRVARSVFFSFLLNELTFIKANYFNLKQSDHGFGLTFRASTLCSLSCWLWPQKIKDKINDRKLVFNPASFQWEVKNTALCLFSLIKNYLSVYSQG